MRLEKVRIKGFRNFDDTEVIFQKKTLIIGANDVGKSNLLSRYFRLQRKSFPKKQRRQTVKKLMRFKIVWIKSMRV